MLVRKTQGFFNLVNALCSAVPSPVYQDVSSDHPLTKMPISAAIFNIIKIELILTTGNKDYQKWKVKSGCAKLGRDFNGFFYHKLSSNLVSTRTIYF